MRQEFGELLTFEARWPSAPDHASNRRCRQDRAQRLREAAFDDEAREVAVAQQMLQARTAQVSIERHHDRAELGEGEKGDDVIRMMIEHDTGAIAGHDATSGE